jgi:acyl carrier protein
MDMQVTDIEHAERDPERVLTTVSELIHEVIGDGGLGPPITLETSFNRDLELESIEFVALAEKLQERYGRRVDFVRWLSGKELDAIIALRVGDLVELILEGTASAEPGPC